MEAVILFAKDHQNVANISFYFIKPKQKKPLNNTSMNYKR